MLLFGVEGMDKQIIKEVEQTFNETIDSIVSGCNKIQRLLTLLKSETQK